MERLGTCPGPSGGPEPGHTVKARTEEVREGLVAGVMVVRWAGYPLSRGGLPGRTETADPHGIWDLDDANEASCD